MVIDTSALVAMLSDEPDAERFEAAVEADHIRLMSTASYLETALVIEARFGGAAGPVAETAPRTAATSMTSVAATR